MDTQLEKRTIRSQMRTLLAKIPLEARMVEEREVCRMVVDHPAYRNAGVVAVFIPLPGEIQVREIITHAFGAGKIVVAPRCLPGNLLSFHHMPSDYATKLESGPYGLQEPPASWETFDPSEAKMPAVMLVPGLAFTSEGCRLGKGKGYYDRTLASLGENWTTMGLCFSAQVVGHLPADNLDKPVDLVVHASADGCAADGADARPGRENRNF